MLNSQVNFTLTNFFQHCEGFSHEAIKRYLKGERITHTFGLGKGSVVTNDITQSDPGAVQQVCRYRWKIAEFHRELKQLTGIEGCQCRKARMVRNHIGCAMLVWIHLKRVARQTGRTIYHIKYGYYSDYLRQPMKSPSIKMAFA